MYLKPFHTNFRNFVEDLINSKPFFALSPHPWIILFDIDGTLLTVDSTYNRTHLRRILDELGIDYPDMENDSFSGRTDHDIFTSFLVNHNFDGELYQQYKSLYLDYLQNVLLEKKDMVNRLPHIDEALEYFFEGDFICGLLTGNYPQAAQIKLKAANIDQDFSFGAFGELEKDRNKLPQIAMDQFQKLYDIEPDPSRFIILGDTPRDVECANKAGMKCVAVTTGKYSREELAKHKPDLVIDNLSNPDQWFNKVVAGDQATTSTQK